MALFDSSDKRCSFLHAVVGLFLYSHCATHFNWGRTGLVCCWSVRHQTHAFKARTIWLTRYVFCAHFIGLAVNNWRQMQDWTTIGLIQFWCKIMQCACGIGYVLHISFSIRFAHWEIGRVANKQHILQSYRPMPNRNRDRQFGNCDMVSIPGLWVCNPEIPGLGKWSGIAIRDCSIAHNYVALYILTCINNNMYSKRYLYNWASTSTIELQIKLTNIKIYTSTRQ